MVEITTQRKLFAHELGDILYVERKLATEVLPKLIDEVRDAELRRGLQKHHQETKRHVRSRRVRWGQIRFSPTCSPSPARFTARRPAPRSLRHIRANHLSNGACSSLDQNSPRSLR